MKPFFVYMLRCADGSYYVGHTDELERRIGEHLAGHVVRQEQSERDDEDDQREEPRPGGVRSRAGGRLHDDFSNTG